MCGTRGVCKETVEGVNVILALLPKCPIPFAFKQKCPILFVAGAACSEGACLDREHTTFRIYEKGYTTLWLQARFRPYSTRLFSIEFAKLR